MTDLIAPPPITIGSYTVELLPLVRFRMDGGGCFGVVPRVLWERAYPYVDDRNRLDLVAYAVLVRGPGVVLVADSGLGDKLDDKTRAIFDVRGPDRSLPKALEARGIAPDDVTHFVYTHFHFDHAGGATEFGADGRLKPVFPKAAHYVQTAQLAWANQPTDKDKASFDPRNWDPVVDAGLLREVEGSRDILPGIELRVVHGHTAGLQMLHVYDGDAGFLYAVDLFMTAAHLKPHYVPAFDNHPLVSLEEKRLYLEEIEGRALVLAFGHDRAQQLYRLQRDDRGGFTAVPV